MSRQNGFDPAPQTMPFVAGEGDALELERNVHYKGVRVRRTATVSVDTADAGAVVHPDGIAKLMEQLTLKVGDRIIHELTGQDFHILSPLHTQQVLVYDDGGFDPTSAGNYDLVMEYVVPAVDYFAPRGALDCRIPGVGVNETFQLQPKWASGTPAGGGDAGTAALLAADPNNAVEMSWATEPKDEVVEEYDTTSGDPLPLWTPMTTVHRSQLYSVAQDDLLVRIDTNKPVMAAPIQSYQRAETTQHREDLIEEASFFGVNSWSDIPRWALSARATAFDPSWPDKAGTLPVLLARGGKHSGRWVPSDYGERALRFKVSAPSNGKGRIKVILFHPIRTNVGVEVRRTRAAGGATS